MIDQNNNQEPTSENQSEPSIPPTPYPTHAQGQPFNEQPPPYQGDFNQQPTQGQTPQAGYQPYGQNQQPYGQPQQPYNQQPHGQPQQPYGHQPHGGQPQPNHGHQPYGQPQQNYGQPPLYQQEYYQQAPQKRAVWPWVLLICLLVGILPIGGCVGLTAYSAILANNYASNNGYYDDYYYDDYYGDDYYDDSYDYYGDEYYGYDTRLYDLQAIQAIEDGLLNKSEKGKYSNGVWEVGVGKDIEPGLYYLEGSQNEESYYYVFEATDVTNEYSLDDTVSYFGNYYTELEEGDVILYSAPQDARMYTAENVVLDLKEPYQSGCYRVGKDMPAGKYTVSYKDNSATSSSQESAVYLMKDLKFESDSITESYYLIEGGSHTITVTDGEYVELYGAEMIAAK